MQKKLKPSERKVTFPNLGRVTKIVEKSLKRMNLEVIPPDPISDDTIKIGVKYSPQMMCLPYKVCLGDYISALEKGANTILAYSAQGTCRYRQYPIMHEHMLRGIGYDFELFLATPTNIISTMKKLTGKSYLSVIKEILRVSDEIEKDDSKSTTWSVTKPNIGIIGEIYCSCEDTINCGLEERIREYGANPFNSSKTGDFIAEEIPILKTLKRIGMRDKKKKYKKQAEKYFNGKLGGHAFENIYNLLWLCDRGIDGILHILPLSCSPEAVISPYIDSICKQNKTPLLRIPLDENKSEANICTRLETFCELIRIRKYE